MPSQLLLLRDVESLGRSGDIVAVKPGFARNFLFPQSLATPATKANLRMRDKLKRERDAKAAEDLKFATAISEKIAALSLHTEVKVDHEGHLYGSVTAADVLSMLAEKGVEIDRKNLAGFRPIKTLGIHNIDCRLQEEVRAKISLTVIAEGAQPQASSDLANSSSEETPSQV